MILDAQGPIIQVIFMANAMVTWCHYPSISMVLVGPDFVGSQLKSEILCHQWCTLNRAIVQKLRLSTNMKWFPHSYKHVKGDSQPSYVVDGDMDWSTCHYHYTFVPDLGRQAKF